MARLSRREYGLLAADVVRKVETDIVLATRYQVSRSAVWRLRKKMSGLVRDATYPELEAASKDTDNTRHEPDAPNNPYQSAKGDPQRPTQQQDNQECEQDGH